MIPLFIGCLFLTFLPETAEFGWLAMNWVIGNIEIIAFHFLWLSWTLTSSNFIVFRINWPVLSMSPPYTRRVPLLYFLGHLRVKLSILLKISLLTEKTIYEKTADLSSLQACHITPIAFTGVKADTGARDFHSCGPVEDWFNTYLGYLQCVSLCTNVWFMLMHVDVILSYMT